MAIVYIITILLCYIFTMVFGKIFIKYIKKKKMEQPIYEDAPQTHQKKAGTPTMGGVTFIIPLLILFSILVFFDHLLGVTLLITIIGFSGIGFSDDRLKIFNKSNQSGLTPKQKLLFQFTLSILISIIAYYTGIATVVKFVFFEVDFGILYFVIISFVIVTFSNATNITDGIDGLLSSVTSIVFGTLGLIALYQGQIIIAIVCFAVASCLISFLVNFNKNPAKIFMGDTGSLFLGALFAVVIIQLNILFVGVILGFIYIVEMLSIIIQVSYFKYTKMKKGKGKRVFLMSPLHHHYEHKGLTERTIVKRACLIQLAVSIVVIVMYMGG